MKRFTEISLKNKIFFINLAVILIISSAIAFLARWILVSSLISELEHRGTAIARTISERGSSYILDKNYPQLLSLIFDEAQLTERRHLITYIYIVDHEDNLLCHTFTRPFPSHLRLANLVHPDQNRSIQLLSVMGREAYDIATPIKEGIYRIGTVHVGLSKEHVDSLVSKLRTTFLSFISLVVILIFIMSHMLSKYITRPISKLTKISDELSRGNFDIKLDLGSFTEGWDPVECPAYLDTDLPCWHFDDSAASAKNLDNLPENFRACENCVFYRKRGGDEVVQLADSFHNMVWSIKLYRKRLSESEDKYRSLFDSGPDPIFVVNSDTLEIIDANPRAVEVYGYTKSEITGMSFLELESDTNRQCTASFAGNDDAEGCVQFQKVLHQRKGDKSFHVNLHACRISYKGIPALIIASTDISEMMEKDAQLIQASKLKSLGEMSAGMAHELNQPLNAIKMGSDFLAMVVEEGIDLSKDHLHQLVTEVSSQVDRAAEIINAMRAFGRKANYSTEKIDINKPVRGVYSIAGKQFELDGIIIKLELSADIPPVLAHENRLQQVFLNLVANARDSIKEKNEKEGLSSGLITIRTYQEDDRVVAEVSDTGTGVREAVRNQIFEPFFTTKETTLDMGLGLAITYRIVKDYGGDIEVRGKEGEGATFLLRFPSAP